ncbi:hydrolase/acyltransferase [Paenibacillus silvisoli]|uniref:hydrolase/acyltransferase n=1 Tax=Paenibacillus silvisoli TaxID=3110539 RepID=UPI002805CA9D|nr:hydrolase/acyltransferase [Paenibacillus silvisoli]
MPVMRYIVMKSEQELSFVEMPESHAYQLSALNLRLHKEIDKLTAASVPVLPYAIAECADVELHDKSVVIESGLDYMNRLEKDFSSIEEKSYPLISLLTEIRALQAQLEQWYEEELDN